MLGGAYIERSAGLALMMSAVLRHVSDESIIAVFPLTLSHLLRNLCHCTKYLDSPFEDETPHAAPKTGGFGL